MSNIYKAVVVMKTGTGLTEDQVTNTFHFLDDGAVGVGGAGVISDALQDFYLTDHAGQSDPLSDYLSVEVNRGSGPSDAVDIKVYDAVAGGSPILVESFEMAAPAVADGLPGEVAICLSYAADLSGIAEETPAGAPGPAGDIHGRARRRGRIFFGPLTPFTTELDGTVVRPLQYVTEDLRICGAALRDSSALAALNIAWAVYSPTAGAAYPIVEVSTDNAFDTQRRRGVAPTARVTA